MFNGLTLFLKYNSYFQKILIIKIPEIEKKETSSKFLKPKECALKFMFSEKDTKFDKTLHRRFDKYVFSKYQIDGEDFVNFRMALLETMNFK